MLNELIFRAIVIGSLGLVVLLVWVARWIDVAISAARFRRCRRMKSGGKEAEVLNRDELFLTIFRAIVFGALGLVAIAGLVVLLLGAVVEFA